MYRNPGMCAYISFFYICCITPMINMQQKAPLEQKDLRQIAVLRRPLSNTLRFFCIAAILAILFTTAMLVYIRRAFPHMAADEWGILLFASSLLPAALLLCYYYYSRKNRKITAAVSQQSKLVVAGNIQGMSGYGRQVEYNIDGQAVRVALLLPGFKALQSYSVQSVAFARGAAVSLHILPGVSCLLYAEYHDAGKATSATAPLEAEDLAVMKARARTHTLLMSGVLLLVLLITGGTFLFAGPPFSDSNITSVLLVVLAAVALVWILDLVYQGNWARFPFLFSDAGQEKLVIRGRIDEMIETRLYHGRSTSSNRWLRVGGELYQSQGELFGAAENALRPGDCVVMEFISSRGKRGALLRADKCSPAK